MSASRRHAAAMSSRRSRFASCRATLDIASHCSANRRHSSGWSMAVPLGLARYENETKVSTTLDPSGAIGAYAWRLASAPSDRGCLAIFRLRRAGEFGNKLLGHLLEPLGEPEACPRAG